MVPRPPFPVGGNNPDVNYIGGGNPDVQALYNYIMGGGGGQPDSGAVFGPDPSRYGIDPGAGPFAPESGDGSMGMGGPALGAPRPRFAVPPRWANRTPMGGMIGGGGGGPQSVTGPPGMGRPGGGGPRFMTGGPLIPPPVLPPPQANPQGRWRGPNKGNPWTTLPFFPPGPPGGNQSIPIGDDWWNWPGGIPSGPPPTTQPMPPRIDPFGGPRRGGGGFGG